MAEWLKRGTVNTFFRGSIPLETLHMIYGIIIKYYILTKLPIIILKTNFFYKLFNK